MIRLHTAGTQSVDEDIEYVGQQSGLKRWPGLDSDAHSWSCQGCSYYDCTAEFRQFWLHSKFSELSAEAPPVEDAHGLQRVPWYQCDQGEAMGAFCQVLLPALFLHYV